MGLNDSNFCHVEKQCGRQSQTNMALLLGVTRSTLIRRIEKKGTKFPTYPNYGPANCYFCIVGHVNIKCVDGGEYFEEKMVPLHEQNKYEISIFRSDATNPTGTLGNFKSQCISSNHAKIKLSFNELYLHDTSSSGTYVDDVKVCYRYS